jgi:hypothetical protein
MPVRPEEFDRDVDLAHEVSRRSPPWVAPDVQHLTSLRDGGKEAGPHGRVRPFRVGHDGQILATLTAVVADSYRSYAKNAGVRTEHGTAPRPRHRPTTSSCATHDPVTPLDRVAARAPSC